MAYAQTDLDLQASNMVPAFDTLSCQDDYLCHIILKSHYAGQSYGSDTRVSHYGYVTMHRHICLHV